LAAEHCTDPGPAPDGSEGRACREGDACDDGLGCVHDAVACEPHGLEVCCLPAGGDGQACIGANSPPGSARCDDGLSCMPGDYCPGAGLGHCCRPTGSVRSEE